jgi:hypothetical protein
MFKGKLGWIGAFSFIIIMASLAFYNLTNASIDNTQTVIIEEKIVKEIKIDREIELLSKYIKTRKTSTPTEVADKIAYEIITQCRLNHIADDIIVGIIEIESMWNIYSKSKAGAKGLMQILLEDGVEILPERAFDISYNIEKGIAILKSKLKKSNGDITLALKYYVGGDPDYHKAVYKYLGKYTLFKISHSNIEVFKDIKIINEG